MLSPLLCYHLRRDEVSEAKRGGAEEHMQVIHGTWIPEEANGFIQRGAFYLWVETDTLAAAPSRRRADTLDHLHPRHLTQ